MATDQSPAVFAKNWRDLIRPKTLDVEKETLSKTYGKFTCEPLERGFGTTLGNSLRRVLLSSLQGAAITAIKIDGVVHEFQTLPDVVEDVTDIVLNLKEVLLKMEDPKPKVIRLDKDGEGRVTAGDISTVDGITVLNPNHHIATLARGGKLHMELMIQMGRGYVSADRNKQPNMSVGTIPIDSLFAPIKKVNYLVTHARVGQQTDYDKLTLEVWTDGSVHPDDAVAFAAKILKDQLSIFINFEETAEPVRRRRFRKKRLFKLNENLDWKSVDELELSHGALGQLLAERQHPLHWRARAEDRGRDAEDEELRPQVAEGDQGNPRRDGPHPRDEARWLGSPRAARQGVICRVSVAVERR